MTISEEARNDAFATAAAAVRAAATAAQMAIRSTLIQMKRVAKLSATFIALSEQ